MLGVGVLAMIIVAVFLDNIDQEQTSQFRGNREPFLQTFLSTFRLLKDWRLVTLIPLTMYSGFEQSFLSGEYTKVMRHTLILIDVANTLQVCMEIHLLCSVCEGHLDGNGLSFLETLRT